MDFYAPLFGKIVESSLWDEDDNVVKVFLTLLAKKDADHVVRASAYQIGFWSRKTEKEVLEALKVLSSPDKRRLEPQPEEGRRIKKVTDGWLVVNGQKYKEMAQEVATRARKARWARDHRELAKDNKEDLVRVHEANARQHLKHSEELKKEIANDT